MFAFADNQVAFIKCSFLVNYGTLRFFTPFPIFRRLRRREFERRGSLLVT